MASFGIQSYISTAAEVAAGAPAAGAPVTEAGVPDAEHKTATRPRSSTLTPEDKRLRQEKLLSNEAKEGSVFSKMGKRDAIKRNSSPPRDAAAVFSVKNNIVPEEEIKSLIEQRQKTQSDIEKFASGLKSDDDIIKHASTMISNTAVCTGFLKSVSKNPDHLFSLIMKLAPKHTDFAVTMLIHNSGKKPDELSQIALSEYDSGNHTLALTLADNLLRQKEMPSREGMECLVKIAFKAYTDGNQTLTEKLAKTPAHLERLVDFASKQYRGGSKPAEKLLLQSLKMIDSDLCEKLKQLKKISIEVDNASSPADKNQKCIKFNNLDQNVVAYSMVGDAIRNAFYDKSKKMYEPPTISTDDGKQIHYTKELNNFHALDKVGKIKQNAKDVINITKQLRSYMKTIMELKINLSPENEDKFKTALTNAQTECYTLEGLSEEILEKDQIDLRNNARTEIQNCTTYQIAEKEAEKQLGKLKGLKHATMDKSYLKELINNLEEAFNIKRSALNESQLGLSASSIKALNTEMDDILAGFKQYLPPQV